MARESILERSARLQARGGDLQAVAPAVVPQTEVHARLLAAVTEVITLLENADLSELPMPLQIAARTIPAMQPTLAAKINSAPAEVIQQVITVLVSRLQGIVDAPLPERPAHDDHAAPAADGPGADLPTP